MSWMETENDDAWLTDDTHIADIDKTRQNAECRETGEVELDLTESITVMEPLHTLPEAPRCSIHVDDYTSYYVFKVQSIRALSTIQNSGLFRVPKFMEIELNAILANSSFVVFIFSVIGAYSFDGYGLFTGISSTTDTSVSNSTDPQSNARIMPVRVQFIRRGLVPFAQVSHIRDNEALSGRSISSAKDGVRVGIASGRALCRGIDKKAYRDDPIHYRDAKYTPRVVHGRKAPTKSMFSKLETDFLIMSHAEYLDFVSRRTASDNVPRCIWNHSILPEYCSRMHRAIKTCSGSAVPLIKMFYDRSIPVNAAEDVVCLFRHATEIPEIQNHLRLYSPKLSPIHALQALELILTANSDRVSLNLVKELKDVLLVHRFNGLSPFEQVRAISVLSRIEGAVNWDPVSLGSDWDFDISHLPPRGLISLCESGLFGMNGLDKAAVTLLGSARLSSLEAAQLAFWTGNRDLLIQSPTLSALPFIVSGYSAWDWGACPEGLLNRMLQSMEYYTPKQIQTTLLALLAVQGSPSLTTTQLFEKAGIWESLSSKHLCLMATDSSYLPAYPVRIPQLALARKSQLTTDIQYKKKFILDTLPDGRTVQFFTFQNDPHWRIFRKFLPTEIETIPIHSITV